MCMLIKSEDEKHLVNMRNIRDICVSNNATEHALFADMASGKGRILLATFETEEDAKKALHEIMKRRNCGATSFDFESYIRVAQKKTIDV